MLLPQPCLDEWKYVSMRPGELSVTHSGPSMMETLPAGSLDSQRLVCHISKIIHT